MDRQGRVRRKGLRSKKMLSVRDHISDRLGQESATMVMVMVSGGSSGLFEFRSKGKTPDYCLQAEVESPNIWRVLRNLHTKIAERLLSPS